MSYLLNISTAVPEYKIEPQDMARFYSLSFETGKTRQFIQKLNFLNKKTRIDNRYSCIPDFKGSSYELYTDNNFMQPVEKRMELYKRKVVPLASQAIDKVLGESGIEPADITHLVTVSCTGLYAPGLEFDLAERYGLQHAEKSAINFLGCYAALKALKQAHYIATSNPEACILLVCAELCSLHFYPSEIDEDIVANLLFADGASAVIVCGEKNKHLQDRAALRIDDIGSVSIPGTSDLMSWNISSTAFRMHLSSRVVDAIRSNIRPAVENFIGPSITDTDYWAIHPGGVRIVEAVKDSLELDERQVEDSMRILQDYGNMSSPTILFILSRIMEKTRDMKDSKKIFSCAFGPGLNIEMISLSSVHPGMIKHQGTTIQSYALQA